MRRESFCANMATRSGSSSLRRRSIWTLASALFITFVSVVSITAYRSARKLPLVSIAGSPQGNSDTAESGANTDAPEHLSGPKPAGTFHSPRYGYSVNLADTPWVRWENLAEVVPEAEWGALVGDYGRLIVIPLALNGLDPRKRRSIKHCWPDWELYIPTTNSLISRWSSATERSAIVSI